MTLDRHSGFRHVPGETGTTLQKGCFYVVVSQGNSGNKVGKWQFLDLNSHNCVEFSMFNVLVNKEGHYKLIIVLVSVSVSSEM